MISVTSPLSMLPMLPMLPRRASAPTQMGDAGPVAASTVEGFLLRHRCNAAQEGSGFCRPVAAAAVEDFRDVTGPMICVA